MTRRVTEGASRASPAATTLMASSMSSGGAFLIRKPLAPAWSAAKMGMIQAPAPLPGREEALRFLARMYGYLEE